MKRFLKALLLASSILSITGCNSGSVSPEEQAIVDEVAATAAIAQVSMGRDGSHVMFAGEDAENTIYKPYMPPHGSQEKPLYATTILISTWFKLEENEDIKADLEWSFDQSNLVVYKAPASANLPHATVTFPDSSFPAYGEEIRLVMTGLVKYHNARATVKYNINLYNTNPNNAK